MSTIYCKYHPRIPARWDCEKCESVICAGCATIDAVKNTAQCPVCQAELESVAATNFIEPFWQRIPKFFKYPSNPQTLIFIVLTGLFFAVAPLGGFMTFALQIFLSLGFMRYAMLVLETSADGRDKPPVVSINVLTSGYILPIKMLATYFIFGYMVYWLGDELGSAAAVIGAILILALIPASTMVIAATHSFFQAINLMYLVEIVKGIGKPYFILYIFLILLSACQAVITSIVGAVDSVFLWPVENMIGLYFTLIIFNMMGYAIFQYHEQLEYPVRLEVDQDYSGKINFKKLTAVNPLLHQAKLLVKEGNITEAISRLAKAVAGSNVSLDVRAYYHQLLISNNQTQAMTSHATDYLNILLSDNKIKEAAKLVTDCYAQKSVIQPLNPDNVYKLALTLKDMRAYKACMAIFNNFHTTYPEHKDIPKLYLLGAQVLTEELHQNKMAAKIMQFLKTKYPQHEMADEIKRYHNIVKSVAKG